LGSEGSVYTIMGFQTDKFSLSTIVYEDSQQSAIALKDVGAGVPVMTQFGTSGIYLPQFDLNDLLAFSIQLPHGMAEEATCTLHPHIHWFTSAASANVVRWQLTYQWVNTLGTIGASSTVATVLDITPTDTVLTISSFDEITKASARISSMVVGNIKRITNGGTNYTGDVYLAFFDVHFRKDTLGSNNETTKTYPS
jgi:hypothetical protein